MTYYYYRFTDDDGRTSRCLDELPTSDPHTARLVLEQRKSGLVLDLHPLPEWIAPVVEFGRGLVRRPIPPAELADFLYNLGVMLRSGLPIDGAIQELREDTQSRRLRQFAGELYESVRAGNTLSSCMDKHAAIIPDTVRSLVTVGEHSGNLDRVLLEAAEHMKRLMIIKQDIRRAMIYPSFVLLCVFGAAYFWIDYVLPNLAKMFRQMNAHLPPLTQAVMHYTMVVRDFIADWYPLLLLLVGLAVVAIARSRTVKRGIYLAAYHLPVSRVLVRTSALAFVMEYLSLLVSAGITLVESLDVLCGALKDPNYREKMLRVRDGLARGNSFSSELKATGLFPGYVTRLIAVGEQSGTLDRQLANLAQDSQRRLAATIASLSEVLKPLIIALAGLFFIFIIVVVLLPVYRLISQSIAF